MNAADADVYIAALQPAEIFADATYQRVLDVPRARKMAGTWDRRLAGILEVSDRGENASPRYAVLDGQHRWAAARFLQTPPSLVANVHSGLSLADEAALFDRLNRQRKQITTWDHWKARRAADDPMVVAIERTAATVGLRITELTGTDGAVWCIGTLEKIAACAGGLELLASTLTVLTSAWGHQRAAFEAPLVAGMAMTLYTFDERLVADRLTEALSDMPPKRIRVNASTMRDTGMSGSLAKLSAVAILNQYNQKSGRRLAWPTNWKGVLPKPNPDSAPQSPRTAAATSSTAGSSAPAARAATPAPTTAARELPQIGNPGSHPPLAVPNGLPPEHPETDTHADAVMAMADRTDADIAQALNIPERSVRRIRADLGIEPVS